MSLPPRSILEEAQRDFLDETRDMLDTMEHHLGELADPSATARRTALDCIARATHSLKGSAGMFGYPGVSRLCHELEEVIALFDDELTPPDRHDRTLLSRVLLGLRGVFDPLPGEGEGAPITHPTLTELTCEMRKRLSEDPARHVEVDAPVSSANERDVSEETGKGTGSSPFLRVDPAELFSLTRMAGELHVSSGKMLRTVQESDEGNSPLTRDLERQLLAQRHRIDMLLVRTELAVAYGDAAQRLGLRDIKPIPGGALFRRPPAD